METGHIKNRKSSCKAQNNEKRKPIKEWPGFNLKCYIFETIFTFETLNIIILYIIQVDIQL